MGSIWRLRISASGTPSCEAPNTQIRFPTALSGLKNGSPWMWSQCVCERRMSAASARSRRLISSLPSGRRPLPASRMVSRPSRPVMLRQEVLPP